MLTQPYTITTWDTATNGEMRYYIDTNEPDTTSSWFLPTSTEAMIESEITIKQKKIIREEIRIWMNNHLRTSIEKEVGQLLKDVDNLKEEKVRLGRSISSLKEEVKRTKKEIREEAVSIEEMLERYANQILRYQILDL